VTDELSLDVERLTFGPDALAHDGRRIVFVPHGAPGDRICGRVVERHPGWARAEIAAVVRPGPERVLPGCPAFPICGGCQWQHVAPQAQRAAKRAIVAEQLARLAGIRDADVLPVEVPGGDWGYRARMTLVVEGRRAGYHRARSHALVEIADCPIADAVLSEHLPAARALVAALRAPLARVTLARAPGGVVLVAHASARPGPADAHAAESLLARSASVRGIVLRGAGTRLVLGDPTVRVPLETGLDLEVPADVFTQVSPAANAALVAAVLAHGGVVPGARVLDLYCGAGTFSLPLARRGAAVVGIERDRVAVAAAHDNAARTGLAASFTADAVAHALPGMSPGAIDAIVLDPPRTGAADAVPALARLRAPRLVYVSCDPATLARDVALLRAHGYRLNAVQPLDLFPQTYHIESVAELHLT
jgi:23S rRNA (uracil1939-C5)-methyltransferase